MFSDFVRELLEKAIHYKENARIKQSYQALNRIKSMTQGTPQASAQIDELLYGEDGVWKGRHEQF